MTTPSTTEIDRDPELCESGDCDRPARVPTPAGALCRECAADLAGELERGD